MRIHVGFTGTQLGATPEQHVTVERLLLELGATDLHHGDCLGADHEVQIMSGTENGLMIDKPRDDRGRFFSRKCVEEGCDGQLVRERDWGEGYWRCDGLREFFDGGPLEACDYWHVDGDTADWRVGEMNRRTAKAL